MAAGDTTVWSNPTSAITVCAVITLRHSPEMTRRPGWAGDDNALPTYGLRAKVRRMGWATLTERTWIISGERRGHHIDTVDSRQVYRIFV